MLAARDSALGWWHLRQANKKAYRSQKSCFCDIIIVNMYCVGKTRVDLFYFVLFCLLQLSPQQQLLQPHQVRLKLKRTFYVIVMIINVPSGDNLNNLNFHPLEVVSH